MAGFLKVDGTRLVQTRLFVIRTSVCRHSIPAPKRAWVPEVAIDGQPWRHEDVARCRARKRVVLAVAFGQQGNVGFGVAAHKAVLRRAFGFRQRSGLTGRNATRSAWVFSLDAKIHSTFRLICLGRLTTLTYVEHECYVAFARDFWTNSLNVWRRYV